MASTKAGVRWAGRVAGHQERLSHPVAEDHLIGVDAAIRLLRVGLVVGEQIVPELSIVFPASPPSNHLGSMSLAVLVDAAARVGRVGVR